VVSLLALSLLLAPPAARAGTYAFSGYTLTSGSGNTVTYTPNNYPTAADSGSAFTHYGGSAPETFSVVANDKITAAFTWQPTNGDSTADPPPSSAIIQQTSSVSWSGGVTGNPPPPTGACATGLPASVSTYTTGTLSKSGGGTYYFVQSQPGSSFTVDCTPTASSSGSSGSPGSGSHGDVRINYSVSAILPPPLQAHSTVDSANWNAMRPRFFSGTNCSVSGTATAYSAPPGGSSYVTSAQLQIGSTTVKQYTDTGTHQASVPLSVVFDSTHFADNTPISIQMTVTDSGGLTYTVSLSGPACNNLVAVANRTSSAVDPATGENVAINAVNGSAKGVKSDANFQPYPGVMTQSSPNNISATGVFDHHKSALINDIATSGYTVFFATTHADPGYLGDCYSVSSSDPNYDPGAYLNDTDIRGAIRTRTTALSAPYLFAYLYGCNGASDPTTIAADFGFSQTSSDDRAFLGYAAPVAVTQQNTNFAVQVWHYLMQGQTVNYAADQATYAFKIQPWPDHNSYTTTVIWGDPNMTLHGKVYNWVSGPTWYR